jgi:biopolymer transport protein ExbD
MKAVVEGIEFEGTPEEFSKLLKDYRQNNKVDKPQVASNVVHGDTPKKNDNSRAWYMHLDFLPNAREFVESLYYYKPEHGGSSLALLVLTTGRQYTLRSVSNKTKCDFRSVTEVIQRSIDAGCQIDIDNSKVSPGSLSRARKVKYTQDGKEHFIPITLDTKVRYVALGTVENAEQVAEYSRKSLSVKKTKEVNYISTGSLPITKIIHK